MKVIAHRTRVARPIFCDDWTQAKGLAWRVRTSVNLWMTSPPDLRSASASEKDALIISLLACVDELCGRIAELGLPPKAPDNSSTPPSQGHKASGDATAKPKGKPHAGAHRPLHPNPTSKRDVFAASRQHCGTDVSDRPQLACQAYDHVEIPDIKPDVTRVAEHDRQAKFSFRCQPTQNSPVCDFQNSIPLTAKRQPPQPMVLSPARRSAQQETFHAQDRPFPHARLIRRRAARGPGIAQLHR